VGRILCKEESCGIGLRRVGVRRASGTALSREARDCEIREWIRLGEIFGGDSGGRGFEERRDEKRME